MAKKLTQDDFKHIPDYILSASIHDNGEAWGNSRVKNNLTMQSFSDGSKGMSGGRMALIGKGYDTTNWQQSAINRE